MLDLVSENPARFRKVEWDNIFTVSETGEYTIEFPNNISEFRMPCCSFTDIKTGESALLEWTFVSKDKMSFQSKPGTEISVKCFGYELKPWRKDR